MPDTNQVQQSPQAPPTPQPSMAEAVKGVAGAVEGMGPKPGVLQRQLPAEPAAKPEGMSGKRKALSIMGAIAGFGPVVEAINQKRNQQTQIQNQHTLDSVWQAHAQMVDFQNKAKALNEQAQKVDAMMAQAQQLPDDDPTKANTIRAIAQVHQQIAGQMQMYSEGFQKNQQLLTALSSDPKKAKLIAEAVGYDPKLANNPNRQYMVQKMNQAAQEAEKENQKSQLDTIPQFQQLPVAQSAASPGLPQKLQEQVLKGAETQVRSETSLAQSKMQTGATLAGVEQRREQSKLQNDYHVAKLKLDQANAEAARDPNNPLVKARILNAEAQMKNAEAKMIVARRGPAGRAGAAGSGKGISAADEPDLVKAIGTGQINPGRMAYLLARNPKLIQDVVKEFPDFDSSKAESYPATYKDFTSGKTSVSLNSGATALMHMQRLRELNTPESHIPHSPAWTAFMNQVDTLSVELAKFYGNPTIPGIAAIKKTLASTLPGNRDAAIRTQAQSMSKKFDSYEQQWKNAWPSHHYQPPMPGLSEEAKASRASLDPSYKGSGGPIAVNDKGEKVQWDGSQRRPVR